MQVKAEERVIRKLKIEEKKQKNTLQNLPEKPD